MSCIAGLAPWPGAVVVKYTLRFKFKASNNEAEYGALISGLIIVRKAGAKKVQVHSDAKLVVSEISGEYEAKTKVMKRYLRVTKRIMGLLHQAQVLQVLRGQNSRADVLSKLSFSTTLDLG